MTKNDIEKEKRIENFNKMRAEKLAEGYQENICTISILKANLMALITAAPIALVCLFIYILKWNGIIFNGNGVEFFINWALFMVLMIAFMAIHEVIHGITWGLFCKNKWKSIHLGVMWKQLTPYCTCKEPLKFGGYILGGLMPLFVLGIALFVVSLLTGNILLLLLSLFNIIGAGGDTTIALMLLKYKKACILDHPTECGFVAFTK
ncbi:MAG: DUF3267 domain-containing protein [Oscillospiraceae bacterium]